jgi:hypothetical protein
VTEKGLRILLLRSSQWYLNHFVSLQQSFGRIVSQQAVLRQFTLHLAADCSFRQIVDGKSGHLAIAP